MRQDIPDACESSHLGFEKYTKTTKMIKLFGLRDTWRYLEEKQEGLGQVGARRGRGEKTRGEQ